MFKSLCLHLIVALCWQHVASRHLVQPNYHGLQQPYYLPYSDYGYTYSGPSHYQSPYHQPYQQPYQQSPLYSPPGTYFDQRRGILRPFPGGGVPVLVDYHKRCSNQYVGLKAHPEQHQYYYVCKPDCVIFGKCQNLQNFNSTSGQCAQHPPPAYIPTCSGVGRFPLFSDCHLYYKCEEDLQPKIYSCPAYMVFSPASKKCISGNKCTPTQISPRSSYIPEYCASKFPPCYENGIFRSPSDCSLYYKCELQKNGVYMQTRLRCPNGNFYDLEKHECLPSEQVPCDCIQVAELVYPKPNTMPYQPAMYPAQYDFDSLEENSYPVEETNEQVVDINCNISEGKSFSEPDEEVLTTVNPLNSETTLSTESDEKNDSEAVVLSDYLDIENDNSKNQSSELEEVAQNSITTTVSSEETTSIEGSGSEADSDEMTTLSPDGENTNISDEDKNEIEDIEADVTTENEEVESATVTTLASEERTDEPDVLTEEPENETLKPIIEEENEVITSTSKEETTTTSTTVFAVTHIPSSSAKPEPCENMVESNETNDKPLPTDKHSKDTSQTQTKTCLPKLATTSSDSESTRTTLVSEFTRGSRSTLHEQNLTTITTVIPTATTQLPTTKITPTSDNLETTQVPEETPLDFDKGSVENEPFETNLLDSETNLETAETTQSSEKTTAATRETTHSPLADTETFQEDNILEEDEQESSLLDTDNELTQTMQPGPLESSAAEDDVSDNDLLDVSDNEITLTSLETTTKQPLVESTISAQPSELEEESSPQSSEEIDVGTTPIPLRNKKTENTPEPQTTTPEIPQTTTVILDSATTTLKPNSDESTDNPTDFTMDDEFDLLDSKITIDNFETATRTAAENLNNDSFENEDLLPNLEHKSSNEKSVTLRHADFSDEEFLPVNSKSTVMSGLPDDTTDINLITDSFEENTTEIDDNFEDTTDSDVKENPETSQEQEEKKDDGKTTTTLKRRQTSPDDTTQLTTVTPPIQITLTADPSAATTESTTNEDANLTEEDAYEDLLAVLDSEVILHDQSDDEVSNNEITSAETTKTSTAQQQFPHTHSTTFTPTQTPTTTPKYLTNTTETTPTSEPCEKHSNTLVLHVREENHEQPTQESPSPKQSLYYILTSKPVINKNNSISNNNNNETVAAPPCVEHDNGEIPRLEIIAERPIDVHFSVCPSTCDKDHKHNYSPTSNRAVLLRWFAKKSKQTMGFETVNEINMDDAKDC
ncbi:cell surface glycoprotein 1 [Calliphora vicina]|uniref:cell surface glycoprotein 1 n=1 Tax=Calliphora vicina TaxID=7373 RepID=UPI00325B5F8E